MTSVVTVTIPMNRISSHIYHYMVLILCVNSTRWESLHFLGLCDEVAREEMFPYSQQLENLEVLLQTEDR